MLDLPLHPLVVHLAVVALPVGALAVIATVLWPRVRSRYGTLALATLSVGALAAIAAKVTGEQLATQVRRPESHASFGDALTIVALATAALAWPGFGTAFDLMTDPGGQQRIDVGTEPATSSATSSVPTTQQGTYGGTRPDQVPPEPNGYLHIGHAKAITVDFGVAEGLRRHHCNAAPRRHQPDAEETEYVDSIVDDIEWLGYHPVSVCHASDYFDQLYDWAELLVSKGWPTSTIRTPRPCRRNRGSFGVPGVDSPVPQPDAGGEPRPAAPDARRRVPRRLAGAARQDRHGAREHADARPGHVPDPARASPQHRRRLAIYPTYDWAHGQSDAIEGTTHSLCTLEFESPPAAVRLVPEPAAAGRRRAEAARVRPAGADAHRSPRSAACASWSRTGVVDGWDDPRMPTLRGLRRRGYPATAMRAFCDAIGITKHQLPQGDRGARELRAPRPGTLLSARMAVLHPLKLVLTNWPTDEAATPSWSTSRWPTTPRTPTTACVRSRSPGAVDRGRRLRRGAAAEVLPALPRARGAAARRVLRHRHRRGQGPRRARRPGERHLRSGDAVAAIPPMAAR
jgi:glutamyl/glutaminyl-tRNA synthetase